LFGKTSANKQRYRCKRCSLTFTWQNKSNKRYTEKHWFDLWIKESYSIRQLSKISGHSAAKLKRIKNYWLSQNPPATIRKNGARTKYLIFDATYFHKQGCCLIVIDTKSRKIIANSYEDKERRSNTCTLFLTLLEQGVAPVAITIDGHTQVTRAIKEVFPKAKIQRCLYHIQRQGLSWLRARPKTQAARDLKELLLFLPNIKTEEEKNIFIESFFSWQAKYKEFMDNLPNTSIAMNDLKRTASVIKYALPNMFHYIYDKNIAPTTNIAESKFSRLKSDFQRHRGLREKHKVAYLKWYIYHDN